MIQRLLSLFQKAPETASGKIARPAGRANGSKRRDPVLEEKIREALSGIDPSLADQVKAGWNSRMRTTAGVALLARNEIWLNPSLREISEGEITRTLLHELAHLLARHRNPHRRIEPHGIEWKTACRDLGIGGEARTHSLPFHHRRLKRRFRLVCPVCGSHHERVRRPRRPLACLHWCRAHAGGSTMKNSGL
jgi:predicted SprT family Zn-dependent metalloprotease